MKLKVIVAEQRTEVHTILSEVFHDLNAFDSRSIGLRDLMALDEVDAIVMPGIFAHERYGGRPIPGVAQILSTRREPGEPRWVVTTPPFAAHVEAVTSHRGKVHLRVVQEEPLAANDETYIVFSKVLKSVAGFNEAHSKQIATLGIDLQFILAPHADARGGAEALRRAYLDEHCA